MRKAIWILWPSFLAAAVGTVLLFSLIDPVDLRFVGPLELGRKAGYTLGFFFLWALGAGSSALTCMLVPVERPLGCTKREDPNAAC